MKVRRSKKNKISREFIRFLDKKNLFFLKFFPNYINKLSETSLRKFADHSLNTGKNTVALKAYKKLLQLYPKDQDLLTQIGIVNFLSTDYIEANKYFSVVSDLREISRSFNDVGIRFLDNSWLLAIGHIAHIDTYLKSIKLGWRPSTKNFIEVNSAAPPPGVNLLKYFDSNISILEDFGTYFDSFTNKNDFWIKNTNINSLRESFWYGPDRDGMSHWFAKHGSDVQYEWKKRGYEPLCKVDEKQSQEFRKIIKKIYGVPEADWFVVLHVRESGFHSNWAKYHVPTRDADIDTYEKAIDFIISQGGWVFRVGDNSMKPLKSKHRLIDYAHSDFKTEELDILLCAECEYFIGTNSGLSLIPPIFGKRCILTNWSPIAVPNWFPNDKFIPKMIFDRKLGRNLTLTELMQTKYGWSQFKRDFESNLEVVDNSPTDILTAVTNFHYQIFDRKSHRPSSREKIFEDIVIKNGGYRGSIIMDCFLDKYPELLK